MALGLMDGQRAEGQMRVRVDTKGLLGVEQQAHGLEKGRKVANAFAWSSSIMSTDQQAKSPQGQKLSEKNEKREKHDPAFHTNVHSASSKSSPSATAVTALLVAVAVGRDSAAMGVSSSTKARQSV
eukprot:m.626666 g.626666  ORF g.626666 m.626666 type:complete len:126 (+) comp58246_c0_seq2:2179-2556(+)